MAFKGEKWAPACYDDEVAIVEAIETAMQDGTVSPLKCAGFPFSLTATWRNRGSLSAGQWPWLRDALDNAGGGSAAAPVKVPGILEFAHEARAAGMRGGFTVDEELHIGSVTTARSKQGAGSVSLASGPYGTPGQRFFGYVKPDGSWSPTRATTPEIVALVERIAADPRGWLASCLQAQADARPTVANVETAGRATAAADAETIKLERAEQDARAEASTLRALLAEARAELALVAEGERIDREAREAAAKKPKRRARKATSK